MMKPSIAKTNSSPVSLKKKRTLIYPKTVIFPKEMHDVFVEADYQDIDVPEFIRNAVLEKLPLLQQMIDRLKEIKRHQEQTSTTYDHRQDSISEA